eukprot:1136474-Pelagomonas_calceolata.AAC.9
MQDSRIAPVQKTSQGSLRTNGPPIKMYTPDNVEEALQGAGGQQAVCVLCVCARASTLSLLDVLSLLLKTAPLTEQWCSPHLRIIILGWCMMIQGSGFFSRIANTIVLKSGIFDAGVRIRMDDAPRRGASTILDPTQADEGPDLGQE